jgi:hypothetical protein
MDSGRIKVVVVTEAEFNRLPKGVTLLPREPAKIPLLLS